MTEDQRELLEKAQQSLHAARLLLSGGHADFAASRAYYAMFYVAEAFLEGDGLAFSKHSAVISAFGRDFARVGRVPVQFHKFLREAQDIRISGDYGAPHAVPNDKAEQVIARAQQFLDLAQRLIGPFDDRAATED